MEHTRQVRISVKDVVYLDASNTVALDYDSNSTNQFSIYCRGERILKMDPSKAREVAETMLAMLDRAEKLHANEPEYKPLT